MAVAYATGHGGGGVATATAGLSPIVVPFAPKVYTRHSGKANVYFNTLSSPVFTEFNSLFYLDG